MKYCPDCEALMINNILCHEKGCPSRDKPLETYPTSDLPDNEMKDVESEYPYD